MKKAILFLILAFPFLLTSGETRKDGDILRTGQTWLCIARKAPAFTKANLKSKKPSFYIRLKQKIKVDKYIYVNNNRKYDLIQFTRNGKTYFTYFQLFILYHKPLQRNINLPFNVTVNRWNNIPFNYKPTDLVRIPKKYLSPYLRRFKFYLRKEALKAFILLIKEAKKAGYKIYIASPYRSIISQISIYDKNIMFVGPKQKGSAKPTHSEHHLGTTCDLTCKAVRYRLTYKFYYTKEFKWLKKNIKRFNMRITYSKNKHKQEGYIWEPWHIRYMGGLFNN